MKSWEPYWIYHLINTARQAQLQYVWAELDVLITLEFRINDLFVYPGHFVISKEIDNVASSFLNNKMC